jgi:PhnB protein
MSQPIPYLAFDGNGAVTMPFGDTFWAKKFGMVQDRFGRHWTVNGALPDLMQWRDL